MMAILKLDMTGTKGKTRQLNLGVGTVENSTMSA